MVQWLLIYYNSAEGAIYFQKYEEALMAINQAIALAPNIANFNKEFIMPEEETFI